MVVQEAFLFGFRRKAAPKHAQHEQGSMKLVATKINRQTRILYPPGAGFGKGSNLFCMQ